MWQTPPQHSKVDRGKIIAAVLLQCLQAIGVQVVRLEYL